jgi:hypothetical protein
MLALNNIIFSRKASDNVEIMSTHVCFTIYTYIYIYIYINYHIHKNKKK